MGQTLRDRIASVKLGRHILKKEFLRYLGPGFLITVGFIDPGNWATNIEGGARHNYDLLWVITLSTLMLILLQRLSARIGIISGKSLAANVREFFPRPVSHFLGFTIFLACVATDVAELLGGALGFHLLFGFPVWLGAILTVALEIYAIIGQRYHNLERMIMGFLGIIALCYVIELFLVSPDYGSAAAGLFIPRLNGDTIYLAMGMLGAVVMPHNIYLHSNVIQSRDWSGDETRKRMLIRFQDVDTTVAMFMGWLVNSAMIIVAAAVFFRNGVVVTGIEQASATLKPLAGSFAQFLFGVALLFSGIGSSITSSMAEANVITGFLGRPEDPRSLLYRVGLIATALPALLVILLNVNSYKILILSQVALSIQLPFTIIPLVIMAASRKVMGNFVSKKGEIILGVIVSAIIIGLNIFLLFETFGGM